MEPVNRQVAKVSDQLIEAMPWLDGYADKLHMVFEPILGQDAPRGVRDFLYGTWLGHPLHPAVILGPLGFWTSALVLDLVGEKDAADLSIGLGVISALGASITGVAQWQDTVRNEKPRRLGSLHAGLNGIATVLYGGSWLMRKRGSRTAGVTLSSTGYALSMFSAWLGGDLAYDLGVGVKRTAFESPPSDWTEVMEESELADGKPMRVESNGTAIMLLKQGDEIHAIAATCTHLGGPLDNGEIEGNTVTCPWHGSVFDVRDGAVVHGPATMPQTAFDVRVQNGRIEVRASAV